MDIQTGYKKHREEKDIYEMSFANRVTGTEIISSPEARISYGTPTGEWIDATDELLGVTVVVGSTIQFTLKDAASDADQVPSKNYRVFIKVNTDQGRILVGQADLEIDG